MKEFVLKKGQLYQPKSGLRKGENGQVVIIGGSSLFHGAPLLSLKVASRIVDMVFFATPEPSVGKVAENFKSKLFSFIWVPWGEVGDYIKKSDAVLIGPGLMRYRREGKKSFDDLGKKSKEITEKLLSQFPNKKWIIDAGALQVMETKFIPKKAILTPNKREYELPFGGMKPQEVAKRYQCILVCKNRETIICSPEKSQIIKSKEIPLTKGGIGDVLAGLVVALLAKNPPFLSACASSWLMMKVINELFEEVGTSFNADDLVNKIPKILKKYASSN
ncbi:MAG TPA: NAD(P)H-hydrate dehydratase [Patescibacteria group bacterium]|nr:NAD(P)H-hydrate dehydratase [Patescibacteria group bacterium]